MVMVLGFVFVLKHLSIEFVGQLVNRRVQVGMGAFSKQIPAFNVNIAFSFLA